MGYVTRDTIKALLNTAAALENSGDYQWGHMGSCNCGFLAREIVRLDKSAIHRAAMQRYGNWSEQLNDYCPASGLLMDDLISAMLAAGFDIDDLKQLETLSNTEVLRSLPAGQRFLRHNVKPDVIVYLRAWAALLQAKRDVVHTHQISSRLTTQDARKVTDTPSAAAQTLVCEQAEW